MANWKIITGIVLTGMIAGGAIVWAIYHHTPTLTSDTPTPSASFGTSDTRTTTDVSSSQSGVLPVVSQTLSSAKIFKISDGPIAGATLITAGYPTSTVARFVTASNGHVFDLVLDSQGAVPRTVSNTTIPSIAEVTWSEKGRGTLLRYLDQDTIKTVHISLPISGATTTPTTRIQFLPAGITSLAVSPDGKSVAYLMQTASGSDGYLADADGGNSKKLFSLPLSQVQISWPAQSTLLAESAPGAGIAGVVFSVDSKTGGVSPLIYAPGITATADRSFGHVVYQTAGDTRATYSQNVKTGLATALSFDPIPELCTWSLATSTSLYCASPLAYVAPNYLDLFHLGTGGVGMSILKYDLSLGVSSVVAIPGSKDGGEQTEMAEIAVSPSDDYLLFIRKGDRSLWGVRLNK